MSLRAVVVKGAKREAAANLGACSCFGNRDGTGRKARMGWAVKSRVEESRCDCRSVVVLESDAIVVAVPYRRSGRAVVNRSMLSSKRCSVMLRLSAAKLVPARANQ